MRREVVHRRPDDGVTERELARVRGEHELVLQELVHEVEGIGLAHIGHHRRQPGIERIPGDRPRLKEQEGLLRHRRQLGRQRSPDRLGDAVAANVVGACARISTPRASCSRKNGFPPLSR
jgi:hypothetical protein